MSNFIHKIFTNKQTVRTKQPELYYEYIHGEYLSMKFRHSYSLIQEMRKFEIKVISRVLRHTHHNQSQAASLMSISRRTLVYRLAELPEIVTQASDNGSSIINLKQRVDRYELEQVRHELSETHNNPELAAFRLGITVRKLNAILNRATTPPQQPPRRLNPVNSGLRQFDLKQLLDLYEKKLIRQTIISVVMIKSRLPT
jgi:transcriptional regulator with PAS, ATPase and Fis domain